MPRGFILTRRSKRRGRRWAAVVPLGVGPDHRKHFAWGGTRSTRREAQADLARLLGQYQAGTIAHPTRMTLGEYLTTWEAVHLDGARSPRHVLTCHHAIRKHIVPQLGTVPLSRLSTRDVQAWIADLAKDHQPASVSKYFAVLRKALNDAVRLGDLAVNPALRATLPTLRHHDRPVPNAETLAIFLERAKASKYSLLFRMGVVTGMRPAELLGLRRQDVNLDAGILSVQHTLQRYAGRVIEGQPKSDYSRRTVGIPRGLAADLRAHLASHPHDLVFCQQNGRPLHAWNINRRHLRKLCDQEPAIPRLRLKDLRHVAATYLLLNGESPREVADLLGHSTTRLLHTYAHVLPGKRAEIAQRLEDRLTLGLATASKTVKPARKAKGGKA